MNELAAWIEALALVVPVAVLGIALLGRLFPPRRLPERGSPEWDQWMRTLSSVRRHDDPRRDRGYL
jgi:hypothetical protein